ncbi:MAG: Gfo/Idh/MocA family oxidoreductase [FCB group bacterium]|jgi:predicted dehydrogenase|nr:Gfo/Idh/MocA family oxidoreductase [FCB group bacterium]
MEQASGGINRRGFLKTAAALTVVVPSVAWGYAANEAVRLGLVGCGGRGPWVGDLFQKHTNTKVVAVHDFFQDRVDTAGENLGVEPARRYTGLDGYKELVASDVDAVAVISPPYFHPEQAVAALDGGKHLYLAKPIAVDVPGCTAIVEAAKRNGAKLSAWVDFQTRMDPLYREAVKRVREGMIGTLVCGQAYYETGRLGLHATPGTEPARLRNWVFDKALSGDIIVEQNIHCLDVANWIFGTHPVKAHGYGGRKARTDVGDCWDHFLVTYFYPDGQMLDFHSNQFATGFDDICARVYGSEGTIDTHYAGLVKIGSKSGTYPGGIAENLYETGTVANVKDFHASIVDGKPIDNTQESANSTMTAILGRTAAYSGRDVTWDEVVAANEKLDPKLDLPADAVNSKPA